MLHTALICGVSLGLANPTLGCLAHKYYLSKFSTFGIFIISGKFVFVSISLCTVNVNLCTLLWTGLTLNSKEIGAAVEAWPVGLFGLVWPCSCEPLFFISYFILFFFSRFPCAPFILLTCQEKKKRTFQLDDWLQNQSEILKTLNR